MQRPGRGAEGAGQVLGRSPGIERLLCAERAGGPEGTGDGGACAVWAWVGGSAHGGGARGCDRRGRG